MPKRHSGIECKMYCTILYSSEIKQMMCMNILNLTFPTKPFANATWLYVN